MENEWSEQFAEVLAAASKDEEATDQPGTQAIPGGLGIWRALPQAWAHPCPEPSLLLPRRPAPHPAAVVEAPPVVAGVEAVAAAGSHEESV